MTQKLLGSYYTPSVLSDAISKRCVTFFKRKNISILEPSVGDGNFIESLANYTAKFKTVSVDIVEKEPLELKKALNRQFDKLSVTGYNVDFLDFERHNNKSYDLIIGNPPYIKSRYLSQEQKLKCEKIHLDNGLSEKKINNIWTAFLIGSTNMLNHSGILSFVLPLELLQVKFSEEIRSFLKLRFKRIEIFTFSELQFDECKGQETIVLTCYKKSNEEGIFYKTINSIEDFSNDELNLTKNISVSDGDKKWTHHFLTSDENVLLDNLKSNVHYLSEYSENKTGIVTAANSFFIVNQDILDKFSLHKYAKKILQRGGYVNGSLSFTDKDFIKLQHEKKPSFLLDFNSIDSNNVPDAVLDYLKIGIKSEIPGRYKCLIRKDWFKVPNITNKAEAFFFKRSHEYPKFILNEDGLHVTDTAYMINPKNGVNINDIAYSFYNSLTLVYAELNGRYYGGGVLELTPNEFRHLPIPLIKCKDIEHFKTQFKSKNSISQILEKNNSLILKSIPGITDEEIKTLENIRKKLIVKRLKIGS